MCFQKTTTQFLFCLTLAVAVCFTVSCTSLPKSQALRQVHVGMTKSDVLTLVGNPTRTDRRHSQDRWVYEVSGADSDALTYIFFAEGRVTYVGDSKAPDGPTGNSSAEAVPNSLAPGGGFRPVGDTDLPEKK